MTRAVRGAARERLGTVREWMTPDPVMVPLERPVREVIRLMVDRGIRHVLVMDGESLAGIVSNRDVGRLFLGAERILPLSAPVKSIMTENPLMAHPDLPLADAARAMLDKKIGALPVVEDGRPIGILTTSDVLEALLLCAEGPTEIAAAEDEER